MKKTIFTAPISDTRPGSNIQWMFALLFILISTAGFGQAGKMTLPSVNIKTLDGSTFNTSQISNNGNPIVISFWATWCSPCKRELNAIAEVYEDWQEETGVKLIAISIDDARNTGKVKPYVNGQDWDYKVFLDPNGDLKRAMYVNTIPHTFLLNGENEIVWQHNSYSPGDEDELYEWIEKVANGDEVK